MNGASPSPAQERAAHIEHSSDAAPKAAPASNSSTRISDAVLAMNRLLNANERGQQQAHRAMASLASEITSASREQADAFDELKTRIDQLEKDSNASEMREGFVDERLNAINERLRATDSVATRCVQIDNRIDALAAHVGKVDDVESALINYSNQQTEIFGRLESQAEQFETVAHAFLAAREDMKTMERSIQDQFRALMERLDSTESAMATQRQFAGLQDEAKQFAKSVDEKLQAVATRMESAQAGMVTQQQFAAVQEDIRRVEQSAGENMKALVDRVGNAESAMATKLQFATVQEDAKRFEQKTDEQLSALTARATASDASLAAVPNIAEAVSVLSMRVTAFEKLEKTVTELGHQHGDIQSQVQQVADSVQTLGVAARETTDTLAERLRSAEERLDGTDTKIMLALGLAYSDGIGVERNDSEAVLWLERAAKCGEAVAQFRMAARYEHGIGVAIDTERAIHLYTGAANQGHVKAMNNLGVLYLNGTAGGQNCEQALHWFHMAAERGLSDAQFNLGVMYERGVGVEASLVDSYKWYALAEAGGDSAATAHADAIAEKLMAAKKADERMNGAEPAVVKN